MAEINVTPMVDVMLVLLIIFMVSAPLLTVGVPLDLPQTQAKSLEQDKTPLHALGQHQGQGVHQRYRSRDGRAGAETEGDHRCPRRHGRAHLLRGDKKVDYGTVMRVMGRLSGAGFKRLALVTEVEQGS